MAHEFSLRYVLFAEQKFTLTANHPIAPKVLCDFLSVVGDKGEVYGYVHHLAECSFKFCRLQNLPVECVEHTFGFLAVYLFEPQKECVAVWGFIGFVGASEPF